MGRSSCLSIGFSWLVRRPSFMGQGASYHVGSLAWPTLLPARGVSLVELAFVSPFLPIPSKSSKGMPHGMKSRMTVNENCPDRRELGVACMAIDVTWSHRLEFSSSSYWRCSYCCVNRSSCCETNLACTASCVVWFLTSSSSSMMLTSWLASASAMVSNTGKKVKGKTRKEKGFFEARSPRTAPNCLT